MNTCPYVCNNKTVYGYCMSTVCINPLYNRTTINQCMEQADYIQVVRCKDCIHYVHWLLDTDHIARFWCDYLEWNPKETDFCSRGYRKGESEDESECD